jgi:hypothetical protein
MPAFEAVTKALYRIGYLPHGGNLVGRCTFGEIPTLQICAGLEVV